MRRVLQSGLLVGGLLAGMLPGVASAAGEGPPDALFGICQQNAAPGTAGANPDGYGPWVIFDFATGTWRTPLGTAVVFTGAGACTFTKPANP
jgi:hypothetical protein